MTREEILERIIDIGKYGFIVRHNKNVVRDYSFINVYDWGNWYYIFPKLSDADLIDGFKGFVVAEKAGEWKGGRAATGIYFYKEIVARGLDSDHSLADWALHTTNNPYIPFGENNYDATNYADFCKKWDEVKKEKDFEKSATSREIKGLQRTILQQNELIDELREKLRFKDIPEMERMRKICFDVGITKTVYYFYDEIENLLKKYTYPAHILEEMLKCYNGKEKGKFLRQRKRVEELLQRAKADNFMWQESDYVQRWLRVWNDFSFSWASIMYIDKDGKFVKEKECSVDYTGEIEGVKISPILVKAFYKWHEYFEYNAFEEYMDWQKFNYIGVRLTILLKKQVGFLFDKVVYHAACEDKDYDKIYKNLKIEIKDKY